MLGLWKSGRVCQDRPNRPRTSPCLGPAAKEAKLGGSAACGTKLRATRVKANGQALSSGFLPKKSSNAGHSQAEKKRAPWPASEKFINAVLRVRHRTTINIDCHQVPSRTALTGHCRWQYRASAAVCIADIRTISMTDSLRRPNQNNIKTLPYLDQRP